MSEYNPADYKVDQVEEHVAKNPAEAKAILAAEQARGDDARKTLVAALEKVVEGQNAPPAEGENEAPVAAEAPSVYVTPSPTPTAHSVLGKDYEVTPERGYRVKS